MTDLDDLDAFAALLTEEGGALLTSLRDLAPADELSVATRLRRDHPAPLVSAALTQARLRQRAVAKFGAEDAARMYFTPDGLEQATRASVATHRAGRFAEEFGVRRVVDLCCGIGGDAVALARAGIAVLAVDRSPLTCAVARANAEALGLGELIEVRQADVAEVLAEVAGPARADGTDSTAGTDSTTGGGGGDGTDGGGWAGALADPATGLFVDPARRGARGGGGRGGRIFDPEAYEPPLSWAMAAARTAAYGAVKVAPGIPHEAVPGEAEAEWVSDAGDVKEAVLWFGGGSPGRTRATLCSPRGRPGRTGPGANVTLLGTGRPDPEAGPVGDYLYEPDGAVIRAHLVAEVAADTGGRLVDPTIAYVTSDLPRPTPFAPAYRITDQLPFNVKRLRALLRERGVGVVEVKKRGSAVEPEELRRKLRLSGRASCTVFLTRVAGAPAMLLGHPLRDATESELPS
ncbi:methyltransferase domain-containing protein [Streptomyces sp. AJS327]|uniref:THUMP-like domain-containing protein n=1 Tax=Streptomyces sp. AJS327 TaxID=2545265 RepID=UPI0015DD6EA9|nr:methyltransferase domain-containing protein [Streptomyces sp. AJS327]MBA0054139.1 methyltransferase domain-containing protein [Streptomyces sp. AJS327]